MDIADKILKSSRFLFPEKAQLCELKEKRLTRDLQHGARNTVKHGSHRAALVMQSGVNSHTAGRIVDCNISHSCNSIIIQC
ncbi:hypothetical protein YC2023_077788 [Brassica napus]